MKYKLCKFRDSLHKLNTLIFSFKAAIIQYKDEW